MAKLAELKKYIGYKFSSGSYTGEDYKSFQTKYINYLKAMCRDNHWQLVNIGRNHYCFSAFIKTDYRGGFNHYTTLEKLDAKAAELLGDMPF